MIGVTLAIVFTGLCILAVGVMLGRVLDDLADNGLFIPARDVEADMKSNPPGTGAARMANPVPDFCDFICPHAEFPPAETAGICRTMSGVWCRQLRASSTRTPPANGGAAAANPRPRRPGAAPAEVGETHEYSYTPDTQPACQETPVPAADLQFRPPWPHADIEHWSGCQICQRKEQEESK